MEDERGDHARDLNLHARFIAPKMVPIFGMAGPIIRLYFIVAGYTTFAQFRGTRVPPRYGVSRPPCSKARSFIGHAG